VLKRLSEFVPAVFEHWGIAAYGSLVTAFSSIYLAFSGMTELPFWISLGGFAACLFIGFFKAWVSERERAETADARYEAACLPKFEVTVLGMVPAQIKDSTWLTLDVRITNLGAQSICREFALKIQNDEIQSDFIPLVPFTGEIVITNPVDGITTRRGPEESLAKKTASSAIQINSDVEGVLLYEVEGTKLERVIKVGTVISVFVADARGSIYSGTFTLTGKAGKQRIHHGMSYDTTAKSISNKPNEED
jgi:hypothetical protein